MSHGPLTLRFLTEEATDYVRGMLIAAASERTAGVAYFTFNVFNVKLDFDARTVTVEDELDPDAEEALPLDSFLAALTQPGPQG